MLLRRHLGSWIQLQLLGILLALQGSPWPRRACRLIGLVGIGALIATLFHESVTLYLVALLSLAVLVTIALFQERPPRSSPLPSPRGPDGPQPPTPPFRPRPPDAPVPAPLKPGPVLSAGAARKLPDEPARTHGWDGRSADDERPTPWTTR